MKFQLIIMILFAVAFFGTPNVFAQNTQAELYSYQSMSFDKLPGVAALYAVDDYQNSNNDIALKDRFPPSLNVTNTSSVIVMGTVTDADGTGISGATVIIDEELTTTDSDGMYEITDLVAGTYTVLVLTPTGPTDTRTVTLVAGDNTVDFVLGILPSIKGTILDTNDNPVSGVTVNAISLAGTTRETATTNDMGEYSFTGLDAGDYIVYIRAHNDDYEVVGDYRKNVTVTEDLFTVADFTLRYTAAGDVRGLVRGVSGLLSGATVTISTTPEQSATTTLGTFEFSNIAPGSYTATITADGYDTAIETVTVVAHEQTTLSITLVETIVSGSINGNVVDAETGVALSGVSVALSTTGGEVATTTTNVGRYSFSDVEAGKYSLTFTYSGYGVASRIATVTVGETTPIQVQLIPTLSVGTVRGSVTDATTGSGIASATVTLSSVGTPTLTTANGSYSFSNIEHGTYTLSVTHDGYQVSTTTITVTAGSSTVTNLQLVPVTAGTTGTITGVVSSDGNPIAGAIVSLSGTQSTSVTNDSGEYAFVDVPTGTNFVLVTADGFHDKVESVIVFTNQQSTILSILTPIVTSGIVNPSNLNLFVSAENAYLGNHVAGPQVIEVVINDYYISDIDRVRGEPHVTINGKILRMVQAVDGNWYGYFADKSMAMIADATSQVDGVGLDFGDIVLHPTNRERIIGVNLNDIDGVAVPPNMNVLREAKDINSYVGGFDTLGQIGINDGMWPFIQLYEFNPADTITIQYHKGGIPQTTTLVFDETNDYANMVLDRATYPTGAQLHATITDAWLNIDPTDEDTWTYDTVNGLPNYQVFDENGSPVGDTLTNTQTDTGVNTPYNMLHDSLGDLMCNCDLILDPDTQGKGTVVTLQNNDNAMIESIADESNPSSWRTINGNMLGLQPVTITEEGPNSGVFALYDDSDNSQLVITDYAERRTSATIGYDDSPMTVLVGFEFATIDIQPIESFNSNEMFLVEIIDGDANKNSRADETLAVSDPGSDFIPTIRTGNPFTLANSYTAVLAMFQSPNAEMMLPRLNFFGADISVQPFSDRAIIAPSQTGYANSIIIDLDATVGDWLDSVNTGNNFRGYNFYNQDVSSFGSDSYDVWILISQGPPIPLLPPNQSNPFSIVYAVQIAEGIDGSSGLVPIDDKILSSMLTDDKHNNWNIGLAIVGDSMIPPSATFPIVADFFSYGFINSEIGSERVANQIIRIEVEETGFNTSTFVGELEYMVVDQQNIYDIDTYAGVHPIKDVPTILAINGVDKNSIMVHYLDLGADGVTASIAATLPSTSLSSIQGIIYHDNNGNGIHNSDEFGIPNVEVHIIDLNGQMKYATTDSTGLFTFRDISVGEYIMGATVDGSYNYTYVTVEADMTITANLGYR